jgi:sulfur-oxidizing protein SoxZ
MARTLIRMPQRVARGEPVDITTLIAHPMETGYRADAMGKPLPRNIIRRFSCRYNGELVFSAELHPAISANPYLAFSTRATESGNLQFSWEGDEGFAHTETMPLEVT